MKEIKWKHYNNKNLHFVVFIVDKMEHTWREKIWIGNMDSF